MQGTPKEKQRAKLKRIQCPLCGKHLECEDRWIKPGGLDYNPDEEKRYQCETCNIDITILY